MKVQLTTLGEPSVDVTTKPLEEVTIYEHISTQNLTMTVAEALELYEKLVQALNIRGDHEKISLS